MKMLIYGLITGILFGFFLQKARVLRYDKQLGALRTCLQNRQEEAEIHTIS